MYKKKNLILIGFSIICIIFIALGIYKVLKSSAKNESAPTSLNANKEDKSEIPVSVRVFKVKRVGFKDTIPLMGTVKSKAKIILKFEINGAINKIYFKEGDLIKKGDLIASLDPKDAELKLEYVRKKFKSAERSYEATIKQLSIYQDLFEAGALIKAKLEEAQIKVKAAEAQLEASEAERQLAEKEFKKINLYAPTTGVLASKEAEKGEVVTPQDEIGSLLDISEVFIKAGIVERDIYKVKIGQKANISVDAYPDKVFKGAVERIYPSVEGKSRTLTIKIRVSDPEKLLMPGMFSRAEVTILELKNALMVPSVSLIKTGKDAFLLPVIPKEYLEEKGDNLLGKVELRRAKVGYLGGDFAQIERDLEEGDLVVEEVQGELKDGLKVKVIGTEEYNN